MATPVVDYLKQDSDMTMHDHTEADLGAILDSRYIKVAGGNSASNIIIENDTSDGDITFKVNDGGVDTTVMTLDGATGNVGIGTTNPGAKLDVWGASGGTSTAIFRQSDGGGGVAINAVSSYGGMSIGSYWNGSAWVATDTVAVSLNKAPTGDLGFYANSGLTSGNSYTPTIRFNVGTGGVSVYGDSNSSATGPFYISGTASGLYGVGFNLDSSAQSNGKNYSIMSGAGSSYLPGGFAIYSSTDNAYRFSISSTGNVGIGSIGGSGQSAGSLLSVKGGASVGSSYFLNTAPTNGLIVEGNVGIGTTSPQSALDIGTGKMTGGTNSATYRNYLDMSGKSTFAAVDFVFPGGTSNAGGFFRAGQVNVAGTDDIFFQAIPKTTSGYGYLEAFNSAGLILDTGNDALNSTSPILFQTNRNTKMTILSGGNVGIGTTSPAHQLHLYSGTDNDQFAIQNTSATGFANFWVQGTGRTWQIGTAGASESTYGVANKFFIFDRTAGFTPSSMRMVIDTSGNVGIGTTVPTNILSLGGNSARTFWLERHTTANTAGNTLTITAGGATSGATDKAGGDLILQGGLSTGSAESGVTIQGCVAGASGTTDRTQTTMIQVLGNKLSFYNQTPVVRPTALTPTGTYVLNTGDAGSDTEITLMRTRINELESKLQGLGLLT